MKSIKLVTVLYVYVSVFSDGFARQSSRITTDLVSGSAEGVAFSWSSTVPKQNLSYKGNDV